MRIRTIAIVSTLVLGTAALAGCGGGDGESPFGRDARPGSGKELDFGDAGLDAFDTGMPNDEWSSNIDEALDDFIEQGLGQPENSIDDDGE